MALDLVINGDRAVVPTFASFSLTFDDFGFLCSLLISVITVGTVKMQSECCICEKAL